MPLALTVCPRLNRGTVRLAAAPNDIRFMRLALRLALRGYGQTSPNPMVGAVLVKNGRVIGQGWHHRAGQPHAEIEALGDAARRGCSVRGATLYVTLEPCSTAGRTPPCTEAITRSDIARVVAAATDPNPNHAGRGFQVLRQAGVKVEHGLLAEEAARLNESFNHWIVERLPFVTVKAAMTLDGKIAAATGESKWITGAIARRHAMRLRLGADAILVGVNTVLADDPSLTARGATRPGYGPEADAGIRSVATLQTGVGARTCSTPVKPIRRLVLDARARTPLDCRLITDPWAAWTTVYVGPTAPVRRRDALARRVRVVVAPEIEQRGGVRGSRHRGARQSACRPKLNLDWILRQLGREEVTAMLIEGGGELHASLFESGLVQRVAFYYAPKVLGEAAGRKAVAGAGFGDWPTVVSLRDIEWDRVGTDLLLTARVGPAQEK
ncbi:MAG: Riboflavin biosynthesis protein RibD [Verrucomicrobia bacterium ADurb.Bin006]|nr:MAG: Riboflavin biosynthesis protein RibD [Verrucomicrobia bacterium ADurb.Bin006]HOA61516.1 bifunctional diaminohydroxyphosphoribosylaminopyrimidine deaminase/5-amino-6-(5-phosphoribosylamino)uracil reductase RibD [Verrucomicrobiota bacterium]HOU88618.1 bifunctional diaminohydroxyphosphoribosylaminopyrimidine deaminase/5-amino-6-(5-phosphoribosylamino)uracil reductase RibD [Verrucomicrobiota bacterium]